jgi:hypothetical protein
MTLSKDICQNCRTAGTWWNKHDDKRWREGHVVCVVKKMDGGYDKVNAMVNDKKIPTHCPYSAEHAVSIEPEKEKKCKKMKS